MAGERPQNPWAAEPVRERGSSPAVPSNPNSRLGRFRSPIAQGWDQMDAIELAEFRVLRTWLRIDQREFVFKRQA